MIVNPQNKGFSDIFAILGCITPFNIKLHRNGLR